MRYEVKFTNQFKKDLKLARKQIKDLDRLFVVIDILAEGEVLESKYKDHSLVGKYNGSRECHIEPDWLLIYEYSETNLVLVLHRLGSQAKLFRKQ